MVVIVEVKTETAWIQHLQEEVTAPGPGNTRRSWCYRSPEAWRGSVEAQVPGLWGEGTDQLLLVSRGQNRIPQGWGLTAEEQVLPGWYLWGGDQGASRTVERSWKGIICCWNELQLPEWRAAAGWGRQASKQTGRRKLPSRSPCPPVSLQAEPGRKPADPGRNTVHRAPGPALQSWGGQGGWSRASGLLPCGASHRQALGQGLPLGFLGQG